MEERTQDMLNKENNNCNITLVLIQRKDVINRFFLNYTKKGSIN